MKTSIGLFNTNQVNLGGFSIPVEGLLSYVDQTWKSGLPMFVSHDMHRPIGWSSTVGLLIAPQFVGIIGAAHLADTDEDVDRVSKAVKGYLNEKYLDVAPEHAQRLKDAIGISLKEDTQVVHLEAVSVVEEGIAARLYPELFARHEDKYGLTNLADLKQVAPGVYEVNGLLIFAHRNFRRSMSHLNTLNGDFLSLLGTCAQREDLQVKVAIDPDIVALPGTWRSPIELQYWWGPKFNGELPEIDKGVTRHEGNRELRIYHGINRMEFWWHSQNDIKTLEAEEVLDNPSWGLSADEYACRYVHSMLDTSSGKPNHLDGAVRIYDTDQLLARLNESIDAAGRGTNYVKLWRIDGPLEVPLWKSLISHFYRDNSLVGEYFKGLDTVLIADQEPPTAHRRPLADYLPRCVEPDEGALITVSFSALDEASSIADVRIEVRQRFKTHEGATDCIELSALDYVKLLRGRHPSLDLPDDNMFMAIEDMDINLPLVSHSGVDAARKATESLLILRDFASGLGTRSADRFLTADLSISYADRQVTFSFAGFVEPLHRLLSSLEPLPGTLEDLAKWCERAHLSSNAAFPAAQYSQEQLQLVTSTGSFIMRRTGATVNEPVPDSDGKYGIAIGTKGPLAEAWQAGCITVVPQFEVRGATCSACGGSYFDCACTALLTDQCTVEVQDCELLGYVWTSRPASARSTL